MQVMVQLCRAICYGSAGVALVTVETLSQSRVNSDVIFTSQFL